MGANMSGGDGRELWTKDECWLVSGWCSEIEDLGSWRFSPDIVSKANASTPIMFDPNVPVEGYKPGSVITEKVWNTARQFLKETAEAGCGIRGSY